MLGSLPERKECGKNCGALGRGPGTIWEGGSLSLSLNSRPCGGWVDGGALEKFPTVEVRLQSAIGLRKMA